MNNNTKTHLLLIDPQNDFVDQERAALPVAGASADLRRVADLIRRQGAAIDAITVTLDSHSPADIAHPAWWMDAEGNHPAAFTAITAEDVESGRWRAADAGRQSQSLEYVKALAAGRKYVLVVWPEHCLVGSWGHAIFPELREAIEGWSRTTLKAPQVIFKGLNPGTEHYSAVRAEVPDPSDPHTLANEDLIGALKGADRILVAGEALSHCVAATVRDLAGVIPAYRFTLLANATSPVPGFENLGRAFVDELSAVGMESATTDEVAL